MTSPASTRTRRRSQRFIAARSRSTSRASTSWSRPTCKAGRLDFTTDLSKPVADADAVFIAVGTPSRRGDGHADLSYVYAAAREIAQSLSRLHRRRHQVDRAGRHRRRGRAHHPRDQSRRPTSSSSPTPNSCAKARRSSDFKRPDRIVVGTDDERGRKVMGEVYRPLSLNQAPLMFTGAPHRRADQICRQRLPRDQDHLHQRDRRPLREGRRQRAGSRARHRPGQPHRHRSSCMPVRAMAARASRRTRWR